jgi:hypothetical protein
MVKNLTPRDCSMKPPGFAHLQHEPAGDGTLTPH